MILAPANNFTGTATIGYTITDSIGGTSSLLIAVAVLLWRHFSEQKRAGNVYVGTNFNYTITVTNLGPGTAASLAVTDDLPSAVNFVSATAGVTINGSQIVWTNLGSLAAGAATNLMVIVTAPVSSVTLTNLTSSGSPTSDPNGANNISLPVFTSVMPISNLAIGKTAPTGVVAAGSLAYTISVTNLGPSARAAWWSPTHCRAE